MSLTNGCKGFKFIPNTDLMDLHYILYQMLHFSLFLISPY